jgi:glycine betaine catabolism B
MRAQIDHIIKHGPHLWTYYLAPETPLRFTPGEYTELYVPHSNPDNRGQHRKFSIASSPTEKHIAILVTFAAANGSTFKQALRAAQPGDEVHISETMGDFVLPKVQSIPLVFVAAGSGISPVLSMAAWIRDKYETRPIQVIHSVAAVQKLLGAQLIQSITPHYTPLVTQSQPDSNWRGQTGHLSAERVIELSGEPQGKRFYIAGPEAAVAALKKGLSNLGVAREDIITDPFLGAPEEAY